MFNITKKEIIWGGRTLSLETGKIARQADGAVIATYGSTVILCTVVANKKPKEDVDFLPLTVNYGEKAYSAGKFPGGFFKREGRPSEKEILISRLIDRTIRPLFPENYYNETQVTCTVLSHDTETDSDIIALIGTAAALSISGIPFRGPFAGAKIGLLDGEFILNPTIPQILTTELDLVVAGTHESVLMVESEAKELTEEVMLNAVIFGHKAFREVIALINEFAGEAAKPVWEVPKIDFSDLANKMSAQIEDRLRSAFTEQVKQLRAEKISKIRDELSLLYAPEGYSENTISSVFKKLEQKIVRGDLLKTSKRLDGRDLNEVRPIASEIGLLPQTHGSALFTRGSTQALVPVTLGTSQDEQVIDHLEGDVRENFMLHYNFPPYSVGEAYPAKAPGRREIGHGKLAWRALHPVMPSKAEFPYTIRIVSEITESNGSSSMATVCGASMSLMDAGVPIKAPVAGIAMGLIKESDQYAVLSDISGDEDHLGDMDFKVAGTSTGITALQMDIKVAGITEDIMKIALDQAREGRTHILGKMSETITEARTNLNKNAPAITSISISKDKIREVIGSGGSVIKKICELSGAKIDIEDSGIIKIISNNQESSNIAIKMIEDIACEPEVGKVYDGKVVKVTDFGAFINFFGSKDGLVHISELSNDHVDDIYSIIKEGDLVKVVVTGIDNRGKVKLSIRLVDQMTGILLAEITQAARSEYEGSNSTSPNRPRKNFRERPSEGGNGGGNGAGNNSDPKTRRKYYN